MTPSLAFVMDTLREIGLDSHVKRLSLVIEDDGEVSMLVKICVCIPQTKHANNHL